MFWIIHVSNHRAFPPGLVISIKSIQPAILLIALMIIYIHGVGMHQFLFENRDGFLV